MSSLSVSYPDFTANTTIVSSQVDQNNQDIVDWANGNIGNDNFETFTGELDWNISTNVLAIDIANSGTAGSIDVTQSGVLASGKYALQVESSGNQTTGASFVHFAMTSGSSTIPLLELEQNGSGAILDANDGTNNLVEINSDGVIKFAGLNSPGAFVNLGLGQGGDSSVLRIKGSDASLSTSNPLYVTLGSTTAGQLTTFAATSNVDLDLTGCQWQMDGTGDQTDIELVVYAINNNGSLAWGAAHKSDLTEIADTKTSATASSVNAFDEMYVSTGLSSGTWPCAAVGTFNANFTDSTDEWAIQTDVGDIRLGPPKRSTGWTTFTPTGSWVSGNEAYTGKYRREGNDLIVRGEINTSGAVTAATLTINLPSGFEIDEALLQSNVNIGRAEQIGVCHFNNAGVAEYAGGVFGSSTTAVRLVWWNPTAASSVFMNVVNAGSPITWGANDNLQYEYRVPVLRWG